MTFLAQTLLLSGWTQPADALAHLAQGAVVFDYSEYASPEEAIEELRKIKPRHTVGWSMGGQLALRAMAAGAIAPKHLTLIGVPVRFVTPHQNREERFWLPLKGGATEPAPAAELHLPGMGEETFRLFRESYARDPSRTKTRFHGLIAKGDRRMREVMGMLGHHPEVENVARWLPWLDDLAAYTLDARALASAPPTLIIHGMNDQIVPHAQGEFLARHLPNAELSSWAEAGHAPHVHDADRLRVEIHAHRVKHGVA